MIKVWRGLGTELFTNAVSFQVDTITASLAHNIACYSFGRAAAASTCFVLRTELGPQTKQHVPPTHLLKVEFPKAADAVTKTRLVGSTFLINMLFFESQNE